MENRRGNEIFLGVVGVATLLVAIIGATFAYFSASAQSGNEAVNIHSTEVALGYWDDTDDLSTELIPAWESLALYTATKDEWIAEQSYTDSDGKTYQGMGLCTDSAGNSVCGVYTFKIGNPGTAAMDVEGMVTVTKNEFQNLYFTIYDEREVQVVGPTKFPTESDADKVVELPALDQTLVGTIDRSNLTEENQLDSSAYIPNLDMSLTENAGKDTNVRTYKMVIWINEIDDDQTEEDSGKILTAAIKFQTEGGSGVTGVIAAADGTEKQGTTTIQ